MNASPGHLPVRPPRGVSLWEVHARSTWMVHDDGQLTVAGWEAIATEHLKEHHRSRHLMRVMVLLLGASFTLIAVFLVTSLDVILGPSAYLSITAGGVGLTNIVIGRYRHTQLDALQAAVRRWKLLPDQARQHHLANADT